MKWRPAARIIVATVLLAVLAGCGGTGARSTAPVTVKTVRCPTTFGVAGERVKAPPSAIVTSLTADVADQLRFYVGGVTVLAPVGWSCTSSVGADGSAGITVHPRGEDSSSPSAAVSVNQVPACQGCIADLVCPFFPNAEAQLGYSEPCPGSKPQGELIHRIGRNVVSLTDSAGVKGNALGSGGVNPARGLVIFLPPSHKRQDSAAEISCTLPAAKRHLCDAILDDYLARAKKQSPGQFAAAWPAPPTRTSPPSPGSTQPGFLAYASNGVLFIQWTRTSDTVTGTLSESYTEQSNPAQVTNASHSFTGVISGSSITLTLDSGDNWNGTLTSSALTLSSTASDGTVSTFTFNTATVADYNNAVAAVAARGNATAGAQAQAQATQQAQQDLNQDTTTLATDISTLQSAVTQLNTDLSQVPTDLAQMRADLAAQKEDLRHLLAAPASGCQDGADYQVASTDNYQVTSTDDYQITSTDDYSITNDQQAVGQAIAALMADSQKERAAQASFPGYTPSGLPSRSEINQTITSASAAAKAVKATWNGYVATVKQLDATSNGYAAQANRACGN